MDAKLREVISTEGGRIADAIFTIEFAAYELRECGASADDVALLSTAVTLLGAWEKSARKAMAKSKK